MSNPNLYNEPDPYAAQWLRNLIAAGHIAPGVVDERSIEDIAPYELDQYTQCHFFAGIGVWSHALRLAGWPDDRPVWTGSCPCQPFSVAGKGAGFSDERHLWPAFHHLIKQCRPATVLGEQVASSDAAPWLDLVQTDMEAMGYAFGAVPFPSASVGAPHIRDRLYFAAHAPGAWRNDGRAAGFVVDASRARLAQRIGNAGILGGQSGTDAGQAAERAGVRAGGLADANELAGRQGRAYVGGRDQGGDAQPRPGFGRGGLLGGLADADGGNASTERQQRGGEQRLQPADSGPVPGESAGAVNGFWRAADWLFCRDGKWRPVEPGSFPLAHGVASGVGRVRADEERLAAAPRKDQGSRVGRLRGYGNALNAQAARVFISAYLDGEKKA